MKNFTEKIRERYKFIVVDEYQDVNPLQEKLIKLLSNEENVCVVGDNDQCIYQWRGTTVKNILTFSDRYPDVISKEITTNYRSTGAIVHSAREFIEKNPDRMEKTLQPWDNRKNKYQEGDIYSVFFKNQRKEIEFILDKIQELRGTKFLNAKGEEFALDYQDMANSSQEGEEQRNTCFVISPIESRSSETRRWADVVRVYLFHLLY